MTFLAGPAAEYVKQTKSMSETVFWLLPQDRRVWEFENAEEAVPDGSDWFFVLNHPRTGSTFVSHILNIHPDVHCGDEDHILPLFMTILGSDYFMSPEHWYAVRYKKRLDITPANLRRLLEAWRACTSPKPVFGDKGEMYFGRFGDACQALFPGCTFLLTVRSPLDTLSSYVTQSWTAHLRINGPGEPFFRAIRDQALTMMENNTRWKDVAFVIEFEKVGADQASFEDTFRSVFGLLGVDPARIDWDSAWQLSSHRGAVGRWQRDATIQSFLSWLQAADPKTHEILLSGSYYLSRD